jgi:fructose-bisphosphate aldolase, class II
MGLLQELNLKPGVIYGDDVLKLFTYAKEKGFAIPAINCVRTRLPRGATRAPSQSHDPIANPIRWPSDFLLHRRRIPRGCPRLQVPHHPPDVRLVARSCHIPNASETTTDHACSSQGGAAFFAGKGVADSAEKREASVAGAVAAAHYIRSIAPIYGVPVVLHSDHCA